MLMCIIAELRSGVSASFFQVLNRNVVQIAACINDLLSHVHLGGSIGKTVLLSLHGLSPYPDAYMFMVSSLCQSLQIGHNVHEKGFMCTQPGCCWPFDSLLD